MSESLEDYQRVGNWRWNHQLNNTNIPWKDRSIPVVQQFRIQRKSHVTVYNCRGRKRKLIYSHRLQMQILHGNWVSSRISSSVIPYLGLFTGPTLLSKLLFAIKVKRTILNLEVGSVTLVLCDHLKAPNFKFLFTKDERMASLETSKSGMEWGIFTLMYYSWRTTWTGLVRIYTSSIFAEMEFGWCHVHCKLFKYTGCSTGNNFDEYMGNCK